MYLRASNVSLFFRLIGQRDGLADLPADSKLGGMLENYKGNQFVRALDDISLDLKQGDRLAIIGHNGSGKSTLLRVLAGIYHPHKGSVECDRAVSSLLNISLGFRPDASGYRNILLKGLIAGKSRAQIDRATPEIADFTELGPYLHMPLRTYSQGMAMRLAFAIATAFSNDILLMDEWIGAGDAQFLDKAIKRMTGFVETAQILVLASHSGALLRKVANKAIWLESGRIREAGPVDELLSRYEADAKASARAARLRAPIRTDEISLKVSPAEILDYKPGAKGIVGELSWDASHSGVDSIELFVVNADGSETLCYRGGHIGHMTTRPWLRPGLEFRLRDEATDALLASVTVLPLPQAASLSDAKAEKKPASLVVTPSEIPVGGKAMVGQLAWDSGGSDEDHVEINVVGVKGEETLCYRGRGVGQIQTGPWLKAGVEFRLRDETTGALLASTQIRAPSTEKPAGNRAVGMRPVSFTVTPAETLDTTPSGKRVAGEVSWDAGDSDVELVEIFVVGANGDETLCCRGGRVGHATTKPWLTAGLEFCMRDAESGETLALTRVQGGAIAMADSNTAAPSFQRSTGE